MPDGRHDSRSHRTAEYDYKGRTDGYHRRLRLGKGQTKNISLILKDWSSGNRDAVDELMPVIYELKKIAAQYLRKERREHTLQPTELAHEAYFEPIDISNVNWQDRAHFFAVSAQVIRHILVDHARAKATDKRGGAAERIVLDEAVSFSEEPDTDLMALDEALKNLATFDEQQSKTVELRLFRRFTIEETAEVLRLSPATIKREWTLAKAWLFKREKDEV